MGNEQGEARLTTLCQMDFLPDPCRAPLLAGVSQITHRESRWSEMAEEYSQKNASAWSDRSTGHSGSTPVATFLPQERDEATEALWEHKGVKQAGSIPPDQIAQKLAAQLPLQASASLHCEDHSAPPSPVDYEHAATLERQERDC